MRWRQRKTESELFRYHAFELAVPLLECVKSTSEED